MVSSSRISWPYTFIVLALLVLIMSVVSLSRTPTDLFPTINFPVVALDWTYTGLNPEEMEGRPTGVYERVALTGLVVSVFSISLRTRISNRLGRKRALSTGAEDW